MNQKPFNKQVKRNIHTIEGKRFNIYSKLIPGEDLHKTRLNKALDAVSLLQSNVLLVESVDAVNHLLYELHLGVSKPVLVRDVVGHTWTQISNLEPGNISQLNSPV